MLGANLVCFQVYSLSSYYELRHSNPSPQTYSYSRHFASSCIRVCGYESAPGGIDVQGQVVAIMHCPVGVDAVRIGKDTYVLPSLQSQSVIVPTAELAFDRLLPDIQPKLEALRALYEGKKIIVARDKLDVVKGVVQKVTVMMQPRTSYSDFRVFIVTASRIRETARRLSRVERECRSSE
jgi:trehalose 6-phosphate synthase/phosphatase